jgi:type IV pilus biogenesis protein CpaD/CtpE
MEHGNKSALVCLIGAVALGAVLAGCARTNPASVAAAPVNTQASQSTTAQASKPAPAVVADAVPEVVVGASRGDDVEVVVKASRNSKLVALQDRKAAH